MKTFDDLEVRRPELARSYLELLKAQPGRPIALFAPRRVGKTFFLDQDLTPVARAAAFTPVYADIWLHRTAPLSAIYHALEEALDDATVPASAVGRTAKTTVKKVGALGAALEFGEEPNRRALPSEPALRLDTLVARLAAARSQPVLLMLDEAQALAESPEGASIMASLRAVLQKRKRDVLAVFTGSSQDALAAMMAASGGPMYQFAQLLNFPVLGDDYLNLLAQHFSRVHKGKRLDLAALRAAFVHLGYKPALMKDLVKELSAEGSTDVEATLRRMASDTNNVRCDLMGLGVDGFRKVPVDEHDRIRIEDLILILREDRGRGFRALRVWMNFSVHGINKLGAIVEQNIDDAQYLSARIAAQPELELLAPSAMNVVCFRVRPAGLAENELDALNARVLVRVQESGIAVPSNARIGGRFAIRVANTNHRTIRSDFDVLIASVLEAAAKILGYDYLTPPGSRLTESNHLAHSAARIEVSDSNGLPSPTVKA